MKKPVDMELLPLALLLRGLQRVLEMPEPLLVLERLLVPLPILVQQVKKPVDMELLFLAFRRLLVLQLVALRERLALRRRLMALLLAL